MLAAAFVAVRVSHDQSAGATIPSPYSHFTSAVTITENGTNVQLWANAIPNHPSPYFLPGDPLYEAYNGNNPNWAQNPNHIEAQSILFTIPENPQAATVHQATPLGPVGIAINGVPFFNQYAGPGQPLTSEINSFDQYNGHPQQQDMYHYHFLPLALTAQYGNSALLGYALDGFPIYGPVENGITLTSADLDQYHGHFGPTADYPSGIYHYNITSDSPYILGTGFYGTPGTVQINAPTPAPTASPTPTPSPTPSPSPTPTPVDADGDGVADPLDNCPAWPNPLQNLPAWAVPAGDDDCDGFSTTVETLMGTMPTMQCAATAAVDDEPVPGMNIGPDMWPVDFNDDQKSNLSDVLKFSPHFNSTGPNPPYDVRYDLNVDNHINLSDILTISPFFNRSCSP